MPSTLAPRRPLVNVLGLWDQADQDRRIARSHVERSNVTQQFVEALLPDAKVVRGTPASGSPTYEASETLWQLATAVAESEELIRLYDENITGFNVNCRVANVLYSVEHSTVDVFQQEYPVAWSDVKRRMHATIVIGQTLYDSAAPRAAAQYQLWFSLGRVRPLAVDARAEAAYLAWLLYSDRQDVLRQLRRNHSKGVVDRRLEWLRLEWARFGVQT